MQYRKKMNLCVNRQLDPRIDGKCRVKINIFKVFTFYNIVRLIFWIFDRIFEYLS